MEKETQQTGFFEKAVYTTRESAYQAQEQVLEFDARFVTETPYGEPIAFGFAHWEHEPWVPTGMGAGDWELHNWHLKGA